MSTTRRRIGLSVVLTVAVCPLGSARPSPLQDRGDDPAQQATPAVENVPAEPPVEHVTETEATWPIDGSFSLRYRGRRNAHEADHDLLSTLVVDAGRATDPLAFHLYARGLADLDGKERGEFAEASDAIGSARRLFLEEAYLRWRTDEDLLSELRVGRQPLIETPRFLFLDGLSVESAELDGPISRAGGYAGISRHLYESSAKGDALYGAFAEQRPIDSTRLRVDWMHAEDETLFADHQDDVFRGQAWWRPSGEFQGHASVSARDRHAQDYALDASWAPQRSDLVARLRWYELLRTQRSQVEELDPFFEQVFEERPFRDLDLSLGKQLVEGIFVDLRARLRRLRDRGDEAQFNREFTNLGVTLSADDLIDTGIRPELFLDTWNSDSTRLFAIGGDVERDVADDWELALGSDFALYRQDPIRGTERQRVRRWWTRLRRMGPADTRLDLRYDFEHDDQETTHTWIASCTWNF